MSETQAVGRMLGMHHDARVDSLVAQLQMTDEQFALFKAGQLTGFSVGFVPSEVRLSWWQRVKAWVRVVAVLVRRLAMRTAGWLR